MEPRSEEIHVDETRARAGSTPHIVRYVLGISLALAVLALSAIWITGAATNDEASEQNTERGIAAGQ